MHRSLALFAIILALSIALATPIPGQTAHAAGKDASKAGPELHSKLRGGLGDTPAKSQSAKIPAARIRPAVKMPDRERSLQFEQRSTTPADKSATSAKGRPKLDPREHAPSRALAANANQEGGFVGRSGTGLGDIYEVEPNDVDAQGLTDLPVNVVGASDETDDIDFYAITATGGENIRIEVIADRIFGTLIDSYVVVYDDHSPDPIQTDDDFFPGSSDSFIQLEAPDAGVHTYFIGVSDFGGLGGTGYEYVLNISVADPPDDVEQESNDTTTLADVVSIPSLYFGLSDAANDVDVVRITGFGGQALIVDVDAEIFLSDMDAVVELYDDGGGYLFGSDDTDGLDPRFNIKLPYTGTYYLAVYDARNRGGDTYYYSMNVTVEDASLAPVITGFKIVNGTLLKRVTGANFVAVNGGAHAEINGVLVPSKPAPKNPTKVVKVSPLQPIRRGDVVTVVNPDGRRSNPGVFN